MGFREKDANDLSPVIILLKLIIVFSALILLTRIKLVLAVIVGAVLMGLFFGMTPQNIVMELGLGLIEYQTLWILGVVGSAMVLSYLMKLSGMLKETTKALSGLISDLRFTVIAIPALIGLIPMPAGALVSAITINDVSDTLNVKAEIRTFLNYWFRNVWEFIWPKLL